MAYKFFGGRGAIICDHCKVMIDADVGDKEYKECYGKKGGDLCWRCASKNKKTKNGKILHPALNGKFHE